MDGHQVTQWAAPPAAAPATASLSHLFALAFARIHQSKANEMDGQLSPVENNPSRPSLWIPLDLDALRETSTPPTLTLHAAPIQWFQAQYQ